MKRASAKSALVNLVTAAVAGMPDPPPGEPKPVVAYAPGRTPWTQDFIVFGPCESVNGEVPTRRARPVAVDDTWRMDVVAVAWQRGEYSPATVDQNVESLMAIVVDVVRANPSLPDLGSISIAIAEIDGPSPASDDTGGFSVGKVTIEITQRIEA